MFFIHFQNMFYIDVAQKTGNDDGNYRKAQIEESFAHRYNSVVYFYTLNCFRFTDLLEDLYKTGNVIKHPQSLC